MYDSDTLLPIDDVYTDAVRILEDNEQDWFI